MAENVNYTSYLAEEYVIQEEPFYLPVGDEIELFEVAYQPEPAGICSKALPGQARPASWSICRIDWGAPSPS